MNIRAKGIFAIAEKPTENHTIYPKDILVKAVETYKQRGDYFGCLTHPDEPVAYNVLSVSHKIISLEWQGNNLMGVIETLDTDFGNQLKKLLKAGIPVGISSRATGNKSKLNETDLNTVKEMDIYSFDVVYPPSTDEYLEVIPKYARFVKWLFDFSHWLLRKKKSHNTSFVEELSLVPNTAMCESRNDGFDPQQKNKLQYLAGISKNAPYPLKQHTPHLQYRD